MILNCKRSNCNKHLIDLPDDPKYSSLSIRCKCGARYRVYYDHQHIVDKVVIEDITPETIESIEKDPTLRPSQRVSAFQAFNRRAKKARDSYNAGFGQMIHVSNRKIEEWNKIASQQIAKVMSKDINDNAVELVNNVAMAYTQGGKVLFVDDKPWDTKRMNDLLYVRRVAERLGVAHILE